MPNLFAYLILCLWPFIGVYCYRRYDVLTASFLTIVVGYLILPAKVNFDFPLIPPLDKESIPALTALFGCIFIKKIKVQLIPRNIFLKVLFLITLLAPVITIINNSDVVFDGRSLLRGLGLHDALSILILQYLKLLPFIIGLNVVTDKQGLVKLLKLFVFTALLYSILALIEIRLSPQLHTWVYGFFPHQFAQQFRFGGFRPVIFMGHGLQVAMFFAVAFCMALSLLKGKVLLNRPKYVAITLYLFTILILCKTVSAFLLGVSAAVIILLSSRQIYRLCVITLASLFLLYPLLQVTGTFPNEALVDFFASYSLERAHSLDFRFYHENILVYHAIEKVYFGWGTWGRNRLIESVTDGYWIITLGQFGLVGFLSYFGLYIYSIMSGIRTPYNTLTMSLSIVLAVVLIDQIPNHSLYSWIWFLVGVLASALGNSKASK